MPALAGNANKFLAVNSAANGVAWVQSLPTLTMSHTQPLVRYVETDQAGAVGAFQTQVEGGAYALLRNTAAARDFSTNVAEHQVNSAGRHLFGGAADDVLYKFIFEGSMRCNGALVATVNVTYTSDGRLKEDVKPIEQALSKVERMRGVSYVRNDLEDRRRFVGVIAQEMRSVLPEAVQEGSDGYLAVDYGALSPVLIEALKELAARVRQLEEARA
ncbi:tail fiber domain-containing protein [Cupriavidus basilensis]